MLTFVQERLNAACLLEAILYQNDDRLVKTLQAEEMSIQCSLKECLLSPQAVLREKAKQVNLFPCKNVIGEISKIDKVFLYFNVSGQPMKDIRRDKLIIFLLK